MSLHRLWGAVSRNARPLRMVYQEARIRFGAVSDRKVDFVVAGVQKGGTTALDAYLRRHPEVCMADEKEPRFFGRKRYFERGGPDYRRYHAFFHPGRHHLLLGEATPSYIYSSDIPQRLQAYNRDLKVIVLLRDPVARAYSQWNMDRRSRRPPPPFSEAVRQERPEIESDVGSARGRQKTSYLRRGLYVGQIERLWLYFPPEQTLFLKSEDLRRDPKTTLDRVCAFLGIAPLPEMKPLEAYVGRYPAPMNESDRRYLREFFEPDVRRLEVLLGWDCHDWLN